MNHVVHLPPALHRVVNRERVHEGITELTAESLRERGGSITARELAEGPPSFSTPPPIKRRCIEDRGHSSVEPPMGEEVEELNFSPLLVPSQLLDCCPIALECSLVEETERRLVLADPPSREQAIHRDVKVGAFYDHILVRMVVTERVKPRARF